MQKLADTFWNIRGVFRVVGINIGTHMSVVKRGNGRFVIIDGCELDDAQRAAAPQTEKATEIAKPVHRSKSARQARRRTRSKS